MDYDLGFGTEFGPDQFENTKDFYDRKKEFEAETANIFPYCPFCGSLKIQIKVAIGRKDHVSCENCNAIWHIYFSRVQEHNMRWAKLESVTKDGKGKELLGKK